MTEADQLRVQPLPGGFVPGENDPLITDQDGARIDRGGDLGTLLEGPLRPSDPVTDALVHRNRHTLIASMPFTRQASRLDERGALKHRVSQLPWLAHDAAIAWHGVARPLTRKVAHVTNRLDLRFPLERAPFPAQRAPFPDACCEIPC